MPEPLVDRHFLERLERLTLHWQKSFNGLVGGRKASRFAGSGQEFLDHRNFHTGDDLRAVNWRAYMRFERFFLKTFQVEPRVPVRLLLDVSASMAAGTLPGGVTKFDYARRLTAALIYIGLVRLDNIVLQPFAEHAHQPFFATGGRHRFHAAESFLRELVPAGRTDFRDLSRQYLSMYSQRGFTIVLSDFLADSDCFRPLQYLADFGHELLIVQLWTPTDREPAAEGEIDLIDSESGEHRKAFFDQRARRQYVQAFDAHAEQLKRLALRNGGRYAGISVQTPIDEVLFGDLVMAVPA
ncbi:MAG TPA: DUF58 domain-containing protein [Bryobacteraceae bacterium]|jgi:uncharacterized protein (DUF58 family)|nr:DUF58 domain-containing protein [Bryobacteraceae bacterium]